MKKSEVQTHNDSPYGRQYPAINVKCRNWIDRSVIVTRFKCSEEQAQKASEYACNMAVQQFWDDATAEAMEVFGSGVKVYSAGGFGGWLIVKGLAPIKSWDAIKLGKWSKFVGIIEGSIDGLCAHDKILDDIESNQWHKEGAEEYNFVDTKSGTKCIADMKAEAVAAGFAPVIRH